MQGQSGHIKFLFCVLPFFIFPFLSAQHENASIGIEYLEDLLEQDSIQKLENELGRQMDFFKDSKNYDTLGHYVYFPGKVALKKGLQDPLSKSEEVLAMLKKLTRKPGTLYHAYKGLALLASENNENQKSYDFHQSAIEEAHKMPDNLDMLANSAYGMSSEAYRMRKMDLVKKHGLEAYSYNLSNPKPLPENRYSSGNMMGLMMQNENRLDSALVYYRWALEGLRGAKGSLELRYNYPAVLNTNISVILMNQAKFTESIETQLMAVRDFKTYLDSAKTEHRIQNAKYNYLSNINNMASTYVKLGQLERANQLFEYNYRKAKEFFADNSIYQVVFINQLAQAKSVNEENIEALKLINESSEKFKSLSGNYAGFMTFSQYIKANILENMGDINAAFEAYGYSDVLYEQSSPGAYNFDRLTSLREAATFYSRNNYKTEALATANKILTIVERQDEDDGLAIIKALNLYAEIYYNLGDYQKSIAWADRALERQGDTKKEGVMDSLFWLGLKTTPELFKSKSKYALSDTTDIKQILGIYENLRSTIDNINSRSSFLFTDNDRNKLVYKNHEVLSFTKRMALRLFDLNQEGRYFEQVLSMHESALYNRIRAKLDVRADIQFMGISAAVSEKENALRDSLNVAMEASGISDTAIQRFTKAHTAWNTFLNQLKKEYPRYYAMRYATIQGALTEVKQHRPEHTSVVRYMYIEKDLYAYVINDKGEHVVKLEGAQIDHWMAQLKTEDFDIDALRQPLHQLYQILWKPIEGLGLNEKVIIIPDGKLFNLSFEILTPKKLTDFSELAKNSLLSSHTISYNYSLFLLDTNKSETPFKKNFIAFAPEFNGQMKQDYQMSITDSIGLDKTYLTLLPQPFIAKLAERYSERFSGDHYLNERASKQVFLKNAGEHKIIHIGTHAESNNINPELSRLIFAKNPNGPEAMDDNAVYTYEIYNYNLSADLAILTACETGRPSYQPGEGMISLAHAFNYAGSESILTSLWEIDEKSSTEITSYFYEYLVDGLPKDEALKKAKLAYLSAAKGRTLHPQYWAGLILMGDTEAIDLSSSFTMRHWGLVGLVLLIIAVLLLILYQRRSIQKQ